jgi:N-acetylglucosaminyldiphosphoundecaprenol N-acetyl-beta-D-mannosaminyltransferase
LLGVPLRGRVNGTDLVWKCAEISAVTGCAVALIGAVPGVAMRAAKKMQERYPEAGIHAIPTPFELGPQENSALVKQIRAVNAKIILVALGAPRQERWLQTHLDDCGANVGIGIGSSFDIICGDLPRAPRWMRENGLEWFHRMLFEPKRLGRRYLIEDSPFIFHFIAAFARRRFLGDVNKS